MNDTEFTYLKKKILTLTDIDLGYYKAQQMRRRLEGFIGRTEGADLVTYCKRLDLDRNALGKLRDFLTINVSESFATRSRSMCSRLKSCPSFSAGAQSSTSGAPAAPTGRSPTRWPCSWRS